jgi:predicted O-methyltransferase YrrM
MRYEEVSDYVAKLVGEGDELLSWVSEKSSELESYGVHSIDPTRGRLLEILVRMRSAKRVLEIGSGAGYSALWFMRGMGPEGTLDAIEVNPTVVGVLRMVVKKAGLEGRIKIHNGSALELLGRLKGPYDFVFIDAEKDEYPAYLDHAFRLTVAGSTILADNMLWGGSAISGDRGREGVKGIVSYTKLIFNDPRLVSLIIPLGDGMAVSYRVK